MKKVLLTIMVMLFATSNLFAHDIEVVNDDGKTIYYIWINNKTELAVSYQGSSFYAYSNEYSGNIVIPKSVDYEGNTYNVTAIFSDAFRDCSSLTTVYIPDGVTSIGDWAFYVCSSLTSVHISDIAAWCNIKFNHIYSNPLSYAHHLYIDGKEITKLVIPDGVTSIGSYAFDGCSSLTSVNIPDGVTSIGSYAFDGCSSLTSVNIPDGVTSIEDYTFYGCSSLTSVNIPVSVTSIGDEAFNDCSSLNSVHIPDIAAWCNIKFTGYSSNPLYFAKHLYIDGKEITKLVIPDGVTSIGGSAFYGCSGLLSVNIPNSVTSIEDYTFYGCSGLTSVTIPNSLTSIGKYAFYRCSSLTSVTIPNSVTSIGDYTFYGCSSLTSVNIPDGVTSIGEQAFNNCRGLKSVTIPDGVTSIGEWAFYGCSGLTSLSLPEELAIIKKSTFSGCSSLESITIPAKVEFIYQEAFAGCTKLKEVIALPENPPLLYNNSFSNYDITLKAPENVLEKYSSTEPWSKFTTFKTLTGEDLVKKKCEKPTISVIDGKLEFSCATEDVEYNWSITTSNGSSGKGNSVPFTQTFVVSVYASKSGYENSDVTTQEFSGSGLSGDVDGNGVVNVADHVKLSDIIMNQ